MGLSRLRGFRIARPLRRRGPRCVALHASTGISYHPPTFKGKATVATAVLTFMADSPQAVLYSTSTTTFRQDNVGTVTGKATEDSQRRTTAVCLSGGG